MSWSVVVLVAVTALLLTSPSAGAQALLPTAEPALGAAPARAGDQRSGFLAWRPLLALVGCAGGWALAGGPAGPVVGVVAGVAVWVVLGRSEDPASVRRREQLVEELPVAVDLLGSCLDSGAAVETALRSVALALGGPVAEELDRVRHRLAVGVAPAEVWADVAGHPQLGPLGRAVGRAHESGASVGPAVHLLAAELRERSRAEVEARARSIEVRAAAPLGVCLLPAFLLLGVVPLVAGIFSSMELFR